MGSPSTRSPRAPASGSAPPPAWAAPRGRPVAAAPLVAGDGAGPALLVKSLAAGYGLGLVQAAESVTVSAHLECTVPVRPVDVVATSGQFQVVPLAPALPLSADWPATDVRLPSVRYVVPSAAGSHTGTLVAAVHGLPRNADALGFRLDCTCHSTTLTTATVAWDVSLFVPCPKDSNATTCDFQRFDGSLSVAAFVGVPQVATLTLTGTSPARNPGTVATKQCADGSVLPRFPCLANQSWVGSPTLLVLQFRGTMTSGGAAPADLDGGRAPADARPPRSRTSSVCGCHSSPDASRSLGTGPAVSQCSPGTVRRRRRSPSPTRWGGRGGPSNAATPAHGRGASGVAGAPRGRAGRGAPPGWPRAPTRCAPRSPGPPAAAASAGGRPPGASPCRIAAGPASRPPAWGPPPAPAPPQGTDGGPAVRGVRTPARSGWAPTASRYRSGW